MSIRDLMNGYTTYTTATQLSATQGRANRLDEHGATTVTTLTTVIGFPAAAAGSLAVVRAGGEQTA